MNESELTEAVTAIMNDLEGIRQRLDQLETALKEIRDHAARPASPADSPNRDTRAPNDIVA